MDARQELVTLRRLAELELKAKGGVAPDISPSVLPEDSGSSAIPKNTEDSGYVEGRINAVKGFFDPANWKQAGKDLANFPAMTDATRKQLR